MKSKTLELLDYYLRVIKEQGDDPSMTTPTAPEDSPAPDPSQPPTDEPEPPQEDNAPPTSLAENKYVEALIYGALYTPTPQQVILLNKMKDLLVKDKYINPKTDVLPILLRMINFNFTQVPSGTNTPNPSEELALTPELENSYINELIDATIHEPDPEETMTLNNLRDAFQKGLVKNAREEAMPEILSIISNETGETEFKKDLPTLD